MGISSYRVAQKKKTLPPSLSDVFFFWATLDFIPEISSAITLSVFSLISF